MSQQGIGSDSQLTRKQVKTFGSKPVDGYGAGGQITAEVRFDDRNGNGHNTFSITGTVTSDASRRRRDIETGGCIHEEVVRAFPELADLVKWHLTSTDGPMHYPANAVFLAGDKDCWGRRAGDVSSSEYGVRFGDSPMTHRVSAKFHAFLLDRVGTGDFQTIAFAHDKDAKTYSPHYSLVGFATKWHECPFRDKTAADEFCSALNSCKVEFVTVPTAWSEGKARELDHARSAAVWPEATDAELMAPDLSAKLTARLPRLIAEFRTAVEGLGFTW